MLADLPQLAQACAPEVAAATIVAIVRTESAGHPWSIGVNGATRLARQPKSREEAARWARWLLRQGMNIDIGLMQVNSQHLTRFGLDVDALLDPCTNLRAGSIVLREFYRKAQSVHGADHRSLLSALSAYNTGSLSRGFDNGYVASVLRKDGGSLTRAGVRPSPPLAMSREALAPQLTTSREAPASQLAAAMDAPSAIGLTEPADSR